MLGTLKFDEALHGNMPKRGTGTAIMEAKLLAQLRMRMDEPLFMVFRRVHRGVVPILSFHYVLDEF